MAACPNFSSPQWAELVNKIGVFEAFKEFVKNNDEIPYASNYKESFKGVNATLKIVDVLANSKIQAFYNNQYLKGNKQKFFQEINTEAGNQQGALLIDWMNKNPSLTSISDIMMGLLSEFSYTVEINTAKERNPYQYTSENYNEHSRTFEYNEYEYEFDDYNLEENGGIGDYFKAPISNLNNRERITKSEFESAATNVGAYKSADETNTQHYSNLTVPGGKNYIENEIATPAIIPSIKGHAQFATDNGIGWFRSDDKQDFTQENLQKVVDEVGLPINKLSQQSSEFANGIDTKTRRILEVQSDLFQKGRDNKSLVNDRVFDSKIPSSIEEAQELEKQGYQKVGENDYNEPIYDKSDNSKPNENNFLQLLNKDNNWVTFFVKSIIQDSAKKGYEKVLFPKGDTAAKIEGHETVQEFIDNKQKRLDLVSKNLIFEEENFKINNNKPIVNDYGIYLDSFVSRLMKNDITDNQITNYITNYFRLAKLDWLNSNFPKTEYYNLTSREDNDNKDIENLKSYYNGIKSINKDIKDLANVYKDNREELIREKSQLEKEIEDAKAGKLKISSIAKFYEETIFNVLKKQGYNPERITDEYGNDWYSLNLNPEYSDLFIFPKQQGRITNIIKIKGRPEIEIDDLNSCK